MKIVICNRNRMLLAHADCVERANSTIACGVDSADCGSRDCYASSKYAFTPSTESEREGAIVRLREAQS